MYSIKLVFLLGSTILLFNIIEFTLAAGKNWAVIFVGLDYYKYSYGFESGAYKQYHDLLKGGIPPENIIVISPDTAAFHPNNPLPGLIAYAYSGEDFSADVPVNQYEDVPIDYKGMNIRLEHFLHIIGGQSNTNLSIVGNGRVVKSGPEDNIFLYMHTIGYEGFFLLNNRYLIYTDTFIPYIEDMAEKKKFNKMFIFSHASSPGSMFDNYLDLDKKIMAYTLGARYNEFTMCHWNKLLYAYTSSCQGFEHFTYLDKALEKNGNKETVLDLFSGSGLMAHDEEAVHNLYGDFRLANDKIKAFYGPKFKNSQSLTVQEIVAMRKAVKEQTKDGKSIIKLLTEDESVPQTDRVKIAEKMEKIISESIKNTKIPRHVVNERVEHLPLKKFDCYRNALTAVRSKCLTEKSQFVFLKYASKFAKLCSLNVSGEKILNTIKSVC